MGNTGQTLTADGRELMVCIRPCKATEQRSLDYEISRLPELERTAKARLARIGRVANLPKELCVLDLGSASGGYIAAFSKLGCGCQAVEPWADARKNANMPLRSLKAIAESIPFDDSVDIVHAEPLIEYVQDIDNAFFGSLQNTETEGRILV